MNVHDKSLMLKGAVNYAMAETNFNSHDARKMLLDLATSDRAVREQLLFLGADQAIRTYFTGERRAATKQGTVESYVPRSTPDTPAKALARERKFQRRVFWDRYALFGQMELARATRPDLRESEGRRRSQAAGNIACANFEHDLMERMRGDSITVSGFFNIDTVMELAKKHDVI